MHLKTKKENFDSRKQTFHQYCIFLQSLVQTTSTMRNTITIALLLFAYSLSYAQSFSTISNLKKQDGFFNFYYDESKDKLYLEVDKLKSEFIYVYSLSNGVGSNDIGLDRGQIGQEQIVYFQKSGNKILLIQPNLKFRANTSNQLEKLSVEQAFAKSVLFGFPILDSKNNVHLIDLSPFLLTDAHGIANRLKKSEQGEYKIDLSKSALAMERTKTFPKNTEFEAMLTLTGKAEGDWIKSVSPNNNIVSVVTHHSFIQLPDAGYEPRLFNPQSGAIHTSFYDYASPVYAPMKKQYVTRHRLQKENPAAKVSKAKEPIIYYLDNGTPEPVRSALLEGAKWWNEAYEEIGFQDAFQVKILPEDADPMDVRYNVIQWVHRSTRGWSYGNSVIDPRTGEILKGHVSLGSLRIRQDFMIAQALMNKPYKENDENHQAMLEFALARIRQLSAHEVGHTLGFTHNFASSTNDRASVMDYPHPRLTLNNGEIDFKDAYDVGIGDWDKVTVAYSYSEFQKEEDEKKALDQILKTAQSKGLHFISDSDARPVGGAHALAHLWDNGTAADEALNNILAIRRVAIQNFSADNIPEDTPYSVLEDVFVPLYFLHRYQTEAAVKLIAGLNYTYAKKGDGLKIVESVSPAKQKAALTSLLAALSPEHLAIPQDKLKLFPPRAFGFSKTRESFKGNTGLTFDAIAPATMSSQHTLSMLLHPHRAVRLIEQNALNQQQMGLDQLIDELINSSIKNNKSNTPYQTEIQNTVNFNLINQLITLANDKSTSHQVRAICSYKLNELKTWLNSYSGNPKSTMYFKGMAKQIEENKVENISKPLRTPPGSPIGSGCTSFH